jgi:hypothetical protein
MRSRGGNETQPDADAAATRTSFQQEDTEDCRAVQEDLVKMRN